ncbi:uncharacterized protein MELLADRAFT_94615 [Melampsora larici-populina 98AG31]|uniref:Uncharacterized protein n=1 Tax=Melampsora larici-populina (strain 98AG31 / pathotype 3-4-7) TaxID=747676 RepID=F4RC44_MELLP|nr:uncharacterized protein MELLADRAFT_94615 [Melampsora larici-populina 98AG31]EGG10213.1 hypothetical protein MELLADRAFT_94615 [Melampsora larici-populina 98AG31]
MYSIIHRSHLILFNMRGKSGCETYESQPRRTSRVTTPLRLEPGMIQPSQDSGRGLFLPSSQVPLSISSAPKPSARKRGRSTSRSDCETVVSHIVPNPPKRSKRSGIERKKAVSQKKTSLPQSKGKKAVSTASTATAASGPSNQQHSVAPSVSSHAPSANLRQDSDDENARIRKKKKKPEGALELKDEVYDDVGLYFGEPTRGEED